MSQNRLSVLFLLSAQSARYIKHMSTSSGHHYNDHRTYAPCAVLNLSLDACVQHRPQRDDRDAQSRTLQSPHAAWQRGRPGCGLGHRQRGAAEHLWRAAGPTPVAGATAMAEEGSRTAMSSDAPDIALTCAVCAAEDGAVENELELGARRGSRRG